MKQLNVGMLFDALCDVVLHEYSAKQTIREREGRNDIMPLIHFIQNERRNRGLPPLNFTIKPEGMKLSWSEWNSGGGCMIWSCDLTDGKSIQLSDECCFLVDIPSKEYWELEDWEDQGKHCLAECDMSDIAQGRDIDFLFCPFVGQEMADLILADVNIIAEFI